MGPQAELPEPGYFEHTHLGCYICATLTGLACCVGSYNSQGTWLKIQSARGYWVLTALLATFAYLYVRPFIRMGIGSASRGYINFTSLYIVWLIGAVFYHLPSLESMGVNIKADVSLMIVISLGSLVVLIALWFVHVLLVQFKLLTPKVSLAAGAWSPEVLSSLLLNSVVLGAMCSTYHSFCGNGLLKGGGISSLNAGSFTDDGDNLKSAVCAKWLHPILTSQYPWFSSFMLFGEGGDDDMAGGSLGEPAGHNSSSSNGIANKARPDEGAVPGPPTSIGIDFPWDGIGVVWVPAGNVLSPVLTMWITLIALYIANTVADHAAAKALHAGHMGELRRSVPGGRSPSFRSIWDRLRDQMQARRAARGLGNDTGGAGGVLAGAGVRGQGLKKRRFQRKRPLQFPLLRKTISKASAVTATSPLATWGSHVVGTLQSPAVQGLLDRTHRIGSVAANLWESLHDAFDLEEIRESGNARSWSDGQVHGFKPQGSASCGHHSSQSIMLSRGGSLPHDAAFASREATSTAFCGGIGGVRGLGGKMVESAGVQANKSSVVGRSGGGEASKMFDRSKGEWKQGQVEQQGVRGQGQNQEHEPQPAFLPMVPWYSGTSADLYNTCFDLLIQMKFFLGRFDMRTLQAATSASAAEQCIAHPHEGDGYLYEHLEDQDDLWLDFIADTGDGGNSTYAVASALAAPQLDVLVPPQFQAAPQEPCKPHPEQSMDHQQQLGGAQNGAPTMSAKEGKPSNVDKSSSSATKDGEAVQPSMRMTLPRAQLLLLGGDLAYPNPCKQIYESRLLYPFQEAFPPPEHHHPGRMVIHKPDLPPSPADQDSRSGSCQSAARRALAQYPGPSAFAIPGNHDWIDGLETFTNYIQHKGWLGGWLLPQEKSYFALKLPHAWWVFGVDLALIGDIDILQLRYFVNVVEQRLAANDNVLILTHEPIWLLEWYYQDECKSPNLRQLVRGHLRGRARVHLAGDLHFYMRHSFQPPRPCPHASLSTPTSTTQNARQSQPSRTPVLQQQKQQQQKRGDSRGRAPLGGASAVGTSSACAGSAVCAGGAEAPVPAFCTGGSSHKAHEAFSNDHASQKEQEAVSNGYAMPLVGMSTAGGSANNLAEPSLPFALPCPAAQSGQVKHPDSCKATATPGTPPEPPLSGHSSPIAVHALTGSPNTQHASTQHGSSPPFGYASDILLASRDSMEPPLAPDQQYGESYNSTRSNSIPPLAPHQQQKEPRGGSNNASRSNSMQMHTALHRAPSGPIRRSSSVLGGSSDESDSSSISLGGRSVSSRRGVRRVRTRGPGSLRSAQAKHLPSILLHELGRGAQTPPSEVPRPSSPQPDPIQRLLHPNGDLCQSCSAKRRELHHTFDPEHLVTQGGGGAFLHSTHLFSIARFHAAEDHAANATAALYSAALQPCSCLPPPTAPPTRPSSPPPSPQASSSYTTLPAPPLRHPDRWAGTFSTGLTTPPHPSPRTPSCAAPTGYPFVASSSTALSASKPHSHFTPSSLPTHATFNPPGASSSIPPNASKPRSHFTPLSLPTHAIFNPPAAQNTAVGTQPECTAGAARAVATTGSVGDALLIPSGPKCSTSAPHPITILELARGLHGKPPQTNGTIERSRSPNSRASALNKQSNSRSQSPNSCASAPSERGNSRSHSPNSHANAPSDQGISGGRLGLEPSIGRSNSGWPNGDAPCAPLNLAGSPDVHTGSISLGQGVAGAKGVASSLAATVTEDSWVDLPLGSPAAALASAGSGTAVGTTFSSNENSAAASGPMLSPFSVTSSPAATHPSPTQLGFPSPLKMTAEFGAACTPSSSPSPRATQPPTPKLVMPSVQGGLSRAFQNRGASEMNAPEGLKSTSKPPHSITTPEQQQQHHHHMNGAPEQNRQSAMGVPIGHSAEGSVGSSTVSSITTIAGAEASAAKYGSKGAGPVVPPNPTHNSQWGTPLCTANGSSSQADDRALGVGQNGMLLSSRENGGGLCSGVHRSKSEGGSRVGDAGLQGRSMNGLEGSNGVHKVSANGLASSSSTNSRSENGCWGGTAAQRGSENSSVHSVHQGAGLAPSLHSQQQQQQPMLPVQEPPYSPEDEGLYACQAAYPTPDRSRNLGKKNLHLFRLQNTKFDLIGGIWYYLLVVSVMPRCSRQRHGPAPFLLKELGIDFEGGVAAALDADNAWTAALAFMGIYMDTLWAIFMESYVSLGMVIVMGLMCYGFAQVGGVGSISGPVDVQGRPKDKAQTAGQVNNVFGPGGKASAQGDHQQQQQPQNQWRARHTWPWLCARGGGVPTRLLFAGAHAMAHLSTAVSLMLLLELGVEMCIRHENLGTEGMHSLFRWYREYEQVHFPDPQGLRQVLEKVTLGLYPGIIKIAMAVFDIPEAIAVTRTAMCAAHGSLAAISRVQFFLYYGGMLAYFWLLATPAVGLVFGTYLYLCVCYAGVHFDESFSSLRIANYKSMTRMHITREGDLEVYSLALDKVPTRWREDPCWSPCEQGSTYGAKPLNSQHPRASSKLLSQQPPAPYAHDMPVPSRWCPAHGAPNEGWYLIDYFKVCKQRVL